MPTRSHVWLLLYAFGLGVLTCGQMASAAATEELIVIVNSKVVERRLDQDSLGAIFRLSKRTWSNGKTIVPYNYDAGDKLRVLFDRAVLQFEEDDAARFWIDFRVRGGGVPPRRVPSVAMMVRVVARLEGAIGYVPAGTPTEGTQIVARIVNNKVQPVSTP